MTQKSNATPMYTWLKGHVAYGVYVQNNPFIWINPGTPPEIETTPGLLRMKTSDSISTPGWDVPQTRYVRIAYPRKKRTPPKRPVPPTLRLNKLPQMPVQRFRASQASWGRVLRKYYARLAKAELLRKSRYLKYDRLLTRYNERLAKYEVRLKKYQSPRKPIFVRAGKIVFPVNNPFTYTKYETSGWSIRYLYQHRYDTYLGADNFNYVVPKEGGPYIYKEVSVNGLTEDQPTIWNVDDPFPMMPQVTLPSELIDTANKKAIGQLYEKINEDNVHVGNMIAERAQTYGMLTASVLRLKDFLHSPKKKILEYIGLGVTKRVGNDFIQYCFGVQPLVQDVFNIAKQLSKTFEDAEKSDIVKVKAAGSEKDRVEIVYDGAYYDQISTIEYEVRVRYAVQYRIDNPAAASLNAFGLLNPAEILWEVTPWSFVIDWFLPVGKYISSLSADVGLTFEVGTRSTYTRIKRTVTRTYKGYQPLLDQGMSFSGKIEKTDTTETYIREVISTPPVPGLPRFKTPFSTRHILLSLALWRQRH